MKDKIKDLLLCDGYNGVIAGIDHWGILLQVTDDEDDVALGYFTLNDRIYAVLCPDYIDIDIKCPLENYDGCASSQEMDYPATRVNTTDVFDGVDITDYEGKLEVAYNAIVDLNL